MNDKEKCERYKNMLENVVNELDLSDDAISKYGPIGTEPAELVHFVIAEKDKCIAMLKIGMKDASMSGKTEIVLKQLLMERISQIKRFGVQDLHNYIWLSVLTKQIGDVAKILSTHKSLSELDDFVKIKLYDEIVEVAATAISWLENLNRMEERKKGIDEEYKYKGCEG